MLLIMFTPGENTVDSVENMDTKNVFVLAAIPLLASGRSLQLFFFFLFYLQFLGKPSINTGELKLN